MSDMRLCIYFCTDDEIDQPDQVQWLRDWVSPADVRITPASGLDGTGGLPYLAAEFAGLAGEAQLTDDTENDLRIVLFQFPYNAFLDRVENDLDGLLHTFRDVCNANWPRAAFLDVLNGNDARVAVRAVAADAAVFDGIRLWREEVPVVYLDSVLRSNLPPDAEPTSRPDLQVDNGAIFLGDRLKSWTA